MVMEISVQGLDSKVKTGGQYSPSTLQSRLGESEIYY